MRIPTAARRSLVAAALLGACSEARPYADSADPWAAFAEGGPSALDEAGEGEGVAEDLVINELVADSAEGPDWVELFHPGDGERSLDGLRLGDEPEPDAAWAPPAGLALGPGEHLLILCDGDDGIDEDGVLHATFKLSKDGEVLRLWGASGALLDEVAFPPVVADESFGRTADAAPDWSTFSPPTPGASNR